MADIDRLCSKYIVWSMVYIVILTVGCFIIEKLGLFAGLMYPVAVSAGFAIVVESADALVWRKVARKSPDSLTTFYTAVSGFRMLLALATMLVCYIIVGRDAIMPYILVLLVFYFAMLAHHSIFFPRLTNGGKLNSNIK